MRCRVITKAVSLVTVSMAKAIRALGAPAIAGLDADYLRRQLHNFKSAVRGSAEGDIRGQQMAAMVIALDEEAIDGAANYVAGLPSVTPEQHQGDIKAGADYYGVCGACHGPAAQGNPVLGAPSLRGLPGWYLVDQYEAFRSGQRGSHAQDRYGRQMQIISKALPTEKEVNNVVAFITSLQQ